MNFWWGKSSRNDTSSDLVILFYSSVVNNDGKRLNVLLKGLKIALAFYLSVLVRVFLFSLGGLCC